MQQAGRIVVGFVKNCNACSDAAFSEWVVLWQAKEMGATNEILAFRSDGYFKGGISRKIEMLTFVLLASAKVQQYRVLNQRVLF
jgi:hypothetical protein